MSGYKPILMHGHQAAALRYRRLRNVLLVDLTGFALDAGPLLDPAWGNAFSAQSITKALNWLGGVSGAFWRHSLNSFNCSATVLSCAVDSV